MPWAIPEYTLTTRTQAGKAEVLDVLRKKYVRLTAEEEVRQRLVHYLMHDIGVPAQLMAVERGLKYNELEKRFDLLVYGRNGRPLLLAECKTSNYKLKPDAVLQAAVYNSQFAAPYVLVTNGHELYVYVTTPTGSTSRLATLPNFDEMNGQLF